MIILLRDRRTGRWKSRNGEWTTVLAEALPFASIDAAGEQALRCEDEDLVVVLRYENPQCELALNPVYCVHQLTRPEPGLRANLNGPV